VPGRHDPRRLVHIDAHVAFARDERLPGMHPHSHTNRTDLESFLTFGRSSNRIARTRKRNEERITLRVDLEASVPNEHLPEHTPVLGQRLRVPVAEFVQQPRRPLDVGEDERHRSCWQLRHRHTSIARSRSLAKPSSS
jgi:hypothetical protein